MTSTNPNVAVAESIPTYDEEVLTILSIVQNLSEESADLLFFHCSGYTDQSILREVPSIHTAQNVHGRIVKLTNRFQALEHLSRKSRDIVVLRALQLAEDIKRGKVQAPGVVTEPASTPPAPVEAHVPILEPEVTIDALDQEELSLQTLEPTNDDVASESETSETEAISEPLSKAEVEAASEVSLVVRVREAKTRKPREKHKTKLEDSNLSQIDEDWILRQVLLRTQDRGKASYRSRRVKFRQKQLRRTRWWKRRNT